MSFEGFSKGRDGRMPRQLNITRKNSTGPRSASRKTLCRERTFPLLTGRWTPWALLVLGVALALVSGANLRLDEDGKQLFDGSCPKMLASMRATTSATCREPAVLSTNQDRRRQRGRSDNASSSTQGGLLDRLIYSRVEPSAMPITEGRIPQASIVGDLARRSRGIPRVRIVNLLFASYLILCLIIVFALRYTTGRLERRLRALERKREESKFESQFWASISHEIRTPLACIIGLTDILSQQPLPRESWEHMRTISASGKALELLLADTLEFAKFSARGSLPVATRLFDVRKTLEQAMDLACATFCPRNVAAAGTAPLTRERGGRTTARGRDEGGSGGNPGTNSDGVDAFRVRLTIDPSVPRGSMLGDAGRIRQCLINLVSNASKFTSKGEIAVAVSCASPDGASSIESGARGCRPSVNFTGRADQSNCRPFLHLRLQRAIEWVRHVVAMAKNKPNTTSAGFKAADKADKMPMTSGKETMEKEDSSSYLNGVQERVMMRVVVEDTGVGMRPEQVQRLFHPFTQVHARGGGGESVGGTGLGLVICRSLCEAMGGAVNCKSTPGKGSAFEFSCQLGYPLCSASCDRKRKCSSWSAGSTNTESDEDSLTDEGCRHRSTGRATASTDTAGSFDDAPASKRCGDVSVVCEFREPQRESRTDPQESLELTWNKSMSDPRFQKGPVRAPAPVASMAHTAAPLDPPGRSSLSMQFELAMAAFDAPAKELEPRDNHSGMETKSNRADASERAIFGPFPCIAGGDRPMRILVVDDLQVNRLILERMLLGLGVEVFTAEGGSQAVALCQTNTYSAVLMDLVMPGMGGAEATRAIRRGSGASHNVPVVAVTSTQEGNDAGVCMAAGFNDVMVKPVSPPALVERLCRWASDRQVVNMREAYTRSVAEQTLKMLSSSAVGSGCHV